MGAVAALGVNLFFPGLLVAQQAASAGFSSFPADTQQIAYSNLAQLRSSADYPEIRQHVLYQQLRGFQEFLRAEGVDPEKDIDEVMLGWHGEFLTGPGSFGVAAGRFKPDKLQESFLQAQLPVQSYSGFDLLSFGSGVDPADTFFTFLDSSLAAFGRLHDLKTILDIRQGSLPALEANQAFQNYETEMEGSSPQWGILTGKAAANLLVSWFSGGKKGAIDFTAFLEPVQAVLYQVDWDGGFTAHITVVCKTPASAAGLLQLVNVLKASPVLAATGEGAPGPASLLKEVDARQNGSRLELSASGPPDALDQVLSH
jgi:hypothetical protein